MILTFSKDSYVEDIKSGVKIHTIRLDKTKRWKKDNKIHFWRGNPRNINAKKKPYAFGESMVYSTQIFEISHFVGHVIIRIDDRFFGQVFHHGLGDVYEYSDCVLTLANNDGFKTVESFLKWFDKDFTGKIIHWTDLKY